MQFSDSFDIFINRRIITYHVKFEDNDKDALSHSNYFRSDNSLGMSYYPDYQLFGFYLYGAYKKIQIRRNFYFVDGFSMNESAVSDAVDVGVGVRMQGSKFAIGLSYAFDSSSSEIDSTSLAGQWIIGF